jgi:hypothetical protein
MTRHVLERGIGVLSEILCEATLRNPQLAVRKDQGLVQKEVLGPEFHAGHAKWSNRRERSSIAEERYAVICVTHEIVKLYLKF